MMRLLVIPPGGPAVFLALFFALSPCDAGSGVKFERRFQTRSEKIIEQVFVNVRFMKVGGPDYVYVIDLEKEQLLYRKKGSESPGTIPFSRLRNQFREFSEKVKDRRSQIKINVGSKVQEYKGLKTTKAVIVPEDRRFITVKLLHETGKEASMRNFYQKLFEKLGFIPIKFNEEGLDLDSPFTEIFHVISLAFSYDQIGIPSIPIFILRSKTVSQMEVLNIRHFETGEREIFKDVKDSSVATSGFMSRFGTFLKDIFESVWGFFSGVGEKKIVDKKIVDKQVEKKKEWKAVIEMPGGKGSSQKKSSDRETPLSNKVDNEGKKVRNGWKSARVRDESNSGTGGSGVGSIDYSIFWNSRSCNFYLSKNGNLFLLIGRGKGYSFSRGTPGLLIEIYRRLSTILSRVRRDRYRALRSRIDKYFDRKFSYVMRDESFKEVNIRISLLARHDKLCYLRGRLFKQYKTVKDFK